MRVDMMFLIANSGIEIVNEVDLDLNITYAMLIIILRKLSTSYYYSALS